MSVAAILSLVPQEEAARLISAVAAGEDVRVLAQDALEKVDWEANRNLVRDLLAELLPIDQFVPEKYAQWRPIVRGAFAFFSAHLHPNRLIPKLVDQFILPEEIRLEDRILIFIHRMPTLQKLGQVLARNARLDPRLKARLAVLENGISDIPFEDVETEIRRFLGPKFEEWAVEIEDHLLAEASVGAVVRFSWRNPRTKNRENGVLKILKPYIGEYLEEEFELFAAMPNYLRDHVAVFAELEPQWLDLIAEVRRLLEQEIRFENEQRHMVEARAEYQDTPGLQIPEPIIELCGATVTAMSEVKGFKITDCRCYVPQRCTALAVRAVEYLVAIPLFSLGNEALFHADPHAGNVLYDRETGDIALLDWSLIVRLSREQRRQLVLLVLGTILRDEEWLLEAVSTLSRIHSLDAGQARIRIEEIVTRFLSNIKPFTIPEVGMAMRLLEETTRAGVFPHSEILIFRKAVATVEGMLRDMAPSERIESILLRYLIKRGLTGLPLTSDDVMKFWLKVQAYGWKLWTSPSAAAGRYVIS